MSLLDEIKEILKGIDETETESVTGWWCTSAGAEFGAERLLKITEAFERHSLKSETKEQK